MLWVVIKTNSFFFKDLTTYKILLIIKLSYFILAQSQPLQLIECDLNILSRSLFEDLDQFEYHQVLQFIKDLGLKAIRPRDLIYDQIIPTFMTGKWQVRSS